MPAAAEIETWLVGHVAAELHLDPAQIDVTRSLTFYGLDSLTAAGLAGELEDWLGRLLPPTLLADHVTIASIARHLTESPPVEPVSEGAAGRRDTDNREAVHDEARIAWTPDWTAAQRRVLRLIRGAVRSCSVLEVTDRAGVPPTGPLIFAVNHLHILDALWFLSVLPRRAAFLVAEEFGRRPIVGQLLAVGDPIYIRRGQSDRAALDRAVTILTSGGVVAIAPEGRLSRTGGLIQGQTGVAYLATMSGAPVVPVVAFGQERATRHWLRLRRVPVHMRFGSAIGIPRGRATARELEEHARRIMRAMAGLMPASYQGVYRTENL